MQSPVCKEGRKVMTLEERRRHFFHCTHPQCKALRVRYGLIAEKCREQQHTKEKGR